MGFLGFKQLLRYEDKLVSPLHKTVVWELYENKRAGHDYDWYEHHTFEVTSGERLHCNECGFHSWKRPEFMQDYSFHSFKKPPREVVWCVVDNNGFVVEHELGYRALHSKLLFFTSRKEELMEWCSDSLSDHMDQELIDWCHSDEDTKWVLVGDYYAVTQNFLGNWLENGRDANLTKPSWEQLRSQTFVPKWGEKVCL